MIPYLGSNECAKIVIGDHSVNMNDHFRNAYSHTHTPPRPGLANMQPTEQAAVHLQNEGSHLPDLVRASFVFRGRTRVRRGCRARRVVRHGAAVHHTDSGVALHHRGRPRARCTTTWLKRPRVSWPSLRGRPRPGGGRRCRRYGPKLNETCSPRNMQPNTPETRFADPPIPCVWPAAC